MQGFCTERCDMKNDCNFALQVALDTQLVIDAGRTVPPDTRPYQQHTDTLFSMALSPFYPGVTDRQQALSGANRRNIATVIELQSDAIEAAMTCSGIRPSLIGRILLAKASVASYIRGGTSADEQTRQRIVRDHHKCGSTALKRVVRKMPVIRPYP